MTTARLISKNKKGECAPRHGDAIADFCFQEKTSLCVRTIAIPSQNETKLILLLSVVIVLFLTIPVSSSKLDRVEPGEIGSSRSFFA